MLAEERHNAILDTLSERGAVSVAELCRRLEVSRETVRRDIALLAESRRLRKTRGGAMPVEAVEPALALRQVTNAPGKRAIGRLAAGLVPDGATVILGGGTTTQAVAEALTLRQGLTVFTNDLRICTKLAGRNRNRVYLLGGELQGDNGIALGPDATTMLARYFADFAFIGAGAVSANPWLMDYSREEGELHKAVLESARTTAVVADHSKFSRFAPVRVDRLEKVGYLITDAAPPAAVRAALEPLGIEILLPPRHAAAGAPRATKRQALP